MAALFRRVLDRATINSGDTIDLAEALDLLEFSNLSFVVTVHEAGTGDGPPLLLIQHASYNETGSYVSFKDPIEIDLTVAETRWSTVSVFTRWVAWFTSGSLTSPAIVTLDVIARP